MFIELHTAGTPAPVPSDPPGVVSPTVGPRASSAVAEASANSVEPWRAGARARGAEPALSKGMTFDPNLAVDAVLRLLGVTTGGPAKQGSPASAVELGALLLEAIDTAARLVGASPHPGDRRSSVARAEPRLPSRPSAPHWLVHSASAHDSGTIGAMGSPLRVAYEGSASAGLRHDSRASSASGLDARGARAYAVAEASLGASADAQGRVHTSLGTAHGRVSGRAELFARAEGAASIDAAGAVAKGSAAAGAIAEVTAGLGAELLGGLVRSEATAIAEGGAGARVEATAKASLDPPAAALRGEAGAFAGARSGVTACAGVLGARGTVTAEVWAGAGVRAELDVGLRDGVLRLDYGVGVALGVGGYQRVCWEIDVSGALGVLDAVADLASGLLGARRAPFAKAQQSASVGAVAAAGADETLSVLMDYVAAELSRAVAEPRGVGSAACDEAAALRPQEPGAARRQRAGSSKRSAAGGRRRVAP